MIPAKTLHELYWGRRMSIPDIAQRVGVAKTTVRGWMREYGIKSRTKRDAALLGPSEWTPERIKRLKEIWYTSMTGAEIRDELGISYTPRSVYAKAAALGLKPRQDARVHRPRPKLEPAAGHQRDERSLTVALTDSIISFEPNRRLQTLWLTALAEVRSARQAQGREVGR